MKVKELIAKLKRFDGDLDVARADDEWGECDIEEVKLVDEEKSILALGPRVKSRYKAVVIR